MPKALDEFKTDMWRVLFGTEDLPGSNMEVLRRVSCSSQIGQQTDTNSISELVKLIIHRVADHTDGDLSEFVEDDVPTEFFYETVLGFLARDKEDQSSIELGDESEDEDVDDTAVNAHPRMFGLDTLFNLIRGGQLDLNPPWQRTVVWTPAKQRELIKSVLLGIPIPSIILHHHNPGTIQERYSIIDGKQRLTSICRFLENKFKLPAFDVEPSHPLYPCRGRWFDKHGQRGKGLDAAYRNRILSTQIPVLLFQQVPEARLRQIFNLYNVSSTRLNAAEIRNAIYQNNAIHRALFLLAGESTERVRLPFLTPTEHDHFISSLQNVLPSTKRFAAIDFLCRYLGYSRAPTSSDVFRAASTSTIINRYFDLCSPTDMPEDIVREIMHVFQRAQDYFDIEEDGEQVHMAFFARNQKGDRKFEALQAITSMICAKLLDRAETLGCATRSFIDQAVRKVVSTVEYPKKQQYTTIWDHEARRFLTLASELSLDLSTFDLGSFEHLANRLGQVRLELPSTDGAATPE